MVLRNTGAGTGAAFGQCADVAALTDNSGGAVADKTIGVITPPTAVTDSTTGTADGTLEALANPTDTPATADALRDDLVAVHWPVLRNWAAEFAARQAQNRTAIVALADAVAELATQVNLIRTNMRSAGLMA